MIVRDDQKIIPTGDTVVLENDVMLIFKGEQVNQVATTLLEEVKS